MTQILRLSKYQEGVLKFVRSGEGHAIVGAVAGSGKSTTLQSIVKAIPKCKDVTVISFNRHISEMMKRRLPEIAKVSTAHSLGMSMLRSKDPIINLDDSKYREIIKQSINQNLPFLHWQPSPEDKRTFDRACYSAVSKTTQITQLTLTDWHDTQAVLEVADLYTTGPWGVSKKFKIPCFADWAARVVAEVCDVGEEIAREKHQIAFVDMLWLPNLWGLKPPKTDFLLVDEAQDLNAAMAGIYLKMAEQGARVIAVGDSHQAIYGFSGSRPDSMARLKDILKATELPLSICYRCPTSHLKLAKRLVSQIEPRDDAEEGDVQILDKDAITRMVQQDDLILCRFTAPLVETCLNLVISRVPAYVRGRNIGTGLTRFIREAVRPKDWKFFRVKFTQYCNALIDQATAEMRLIERENIKDRSLAVMRCFEALYIPGITMNQFCDRIESLFSDSKKGICLSTIHRAKGLEAETVFLLGSDLLPYYRDGMAPWQEQQERNLTYVALTRSKHNLYLCPLKEDALKKPLGGLRITPTVGAVAA